MLRLLYNFFPVSRSISILAGVLMAAASIELEAEEIPVPNGSFEAPVTQFAGPEVAVWEKTPKPEWFDESTNGMWILTTGLFANTPEGSPDHINNADGNQALFIFNVPGAGLFQELASTNSVESRRFESGRSYHLRAGIIGGGGTMAEGSSLLLSLYYREASNNIARVASTPVIFTRAAFPTMTHLIDVTVDLPAVKDTDPWAGKAIGIEILSSTQDPAAAASGGYWDVDQVRLTATTESISLPNGSFELPETTFVDTRIVGWQKTPKPDFFDETANGPWDQTSGVFLNTPPGAADHIDNADGKQALFLFAAPTAGIFQDFTSIDSMGSSNLFTARFEPGIAYRLTAGVIGGGGNMPEGSTLRMMVYYRDNSSAIVPVKSVEITNSKALFPNTTRFVDVSLDVPTVQSSDAWAGKNIGVQLVASTFDSQLAGGYWDIDHIRLTIAGAAAPLTLNFARTDNDLRISWNSTTGFDYQLRRTEDFKTWTDLDAPLHGTGGELSKTVTITNTGHAFYNLVESPTP